MTDSGFGLSLRAAPAEQKGIFSMGSTKTLGNINNACKIVVDQAVLTKGVSEPISQW